MSKKIISVLTALLLIISCVGGAFAADSVYVAEPRASKYLDGAYISLNAGGKGSMSLSYAVYGTKQMDKLGVTKIEIEEFDGFEWHTYAAFSAAYSYNDNTHVGSEPLKFTGLPGLEYRAVLYAYAKDSTGSDSRTYTGSSTLCTR